jgi:hypothetical protein
MLYIVTDEPTSPFYPSIPAPEPGPCAQCGRITPVVPIRVVYGAEIEDADL